MKLLKLYKKINKLSRDAQLQEKDASEVKKNEPNLWKEWETHVNTERGFIECDEETVSRIKSMHDA